MPVLQCCIKFWGIVSVLSCCPDKDYSHPRCHHLCVWYLPRICFLKVMCHVSAQNAEFTFAQHVWPANACFLRFSKACIFSCAVESAEHMFPSWSSLWQGRVGLCKREQAELMAEPLPGEGRKVSDLRSCPGTVSWEVAAEQLPVHSQLLLCCVGSRLPWVSSAAHSVLAVLTHRRPFLVVLIGTQTLQFCKTEQWN